MENLFLEAGINQTLHRMILTLTVNITILVPSHNVTFSLDNSFCIAETIIVGDIPDAYTEINRMIDDIDETDIDDLYDYGASVDN